MNSMTVFTNEENKTLEHRGQCAMLPAGAIPVAMVAGETLVIMGSPHHMEEEILEYVEQTTGIPYSPEMHELARTGRQHVFSHPLAVS